MDRSVSDTGGKPGEAGGEVGEGGSVRRKGLDFDEHYRIAVRCGVGADFDRLSPRRLWIIVEEYNHKRQQQREDLATQAYMTAAWQRAKKLPKLEKVLEDMRPKRPAAPQTPEQMLNMVKQLHAQIVGGGR